MGGPQVAVHEEMEREEIKGVPEDEREKHVGAEEAFVAPTDGAIKIQDPTSIPISRPLVMCT
jgi:hypothetical protein